MERFEIHIVEHCNLNCACCDNYSPLAKEEYLDETTFENDIRRMSELFPYIHLIRLLGGEPLLHPNINFFLTTCRKYFSINEIRITTNAILLSKMPEDFWKCCHDNKITIEYTFYPINLDRNQHKQLAYKYGVSLIPFCNNYSEIKTLWRNPVNDTGDKDYVKNFNKCCVANNCISLKHGNLYTCTRIPNICHFNKYFNKNIKVTEKDYINIYNHTAKEIEEFLSKPIPFCSYCDIEDSTQDKSYKQVQWTQTKYDIKEWYNE